MMFVRYILSGEILRMDVVGTCRLYIVRGLLWAARLMNEDLTC
jgi:hypothetical protein